jgi:serine/threonine-protein kinase RsbW
VSEPACITRDARREHLADLLAFVQETCASLPEDTAFAVRLAAEEVCTNVISHAYPGIAPGPVSLCIAHDHQRVTVTAEDRGVPFDPATAPLPALDAAGEERELGGLGWHLVRQVMDQVRHEPMPGGGNRVTLVKYLP